MNQKGFALIPILLILLLVGATSFSAYLYFSKNSTEIKPVANTVPPISPAPSISTKIPDEVGTEDIDLDYIKRLMSDITWEESSESALTYYNNETLPVESIEGTFLLKSREEDFYSLLSPIRDEEYWNTKGWKDDGSLAADGVTGSAWGFYTEKDGKRRIINFHYEMDKEDGERMFKARETLTEFKCPCKYSIDVFFASNFGI